MRVVLAGSHLCLQVKDELPNLRRANLTDPRGKTKSSEEGGEIAQFLAIPPYRPAALPSIWQNNR